MHNNTKINIYSNIIHILNNDKEPNNNNNNNK